MKICIIRKGLHVIFRWQDSKENDYGFFYFEHICLQTHARAHTRAHTHAGTINDGNIIQVAVFYLTVAEDRILSSKLWHFFHTGCHWSQQVVCFSFSPSDWMIEMSIISLQKGWWTRAGSVTALFLHSSTHINHKMLQMRDRASVRKMDKRPRKKNTISASRFNSFFLLKKKKKNCITETDFHSSFNWLQHIL